MKASICSVDKKFNQSNMKNLTGFLVATALMAVGATSSLATLSVGPYYSTTVPATLTDWGNSIAVPQFNPTLGTLESVTLSFTSTAATTWGVSNAVGAGTASHLSANTFVYVSVEDSGQNFLNDDPQLSLVTPAYTPANLAGGLTASSGPESVTASSTNSYTTSAVLSEFTGHGNVNLAASTFTLTSEMSHNGNVTWTQNTTAGLSGFVIYTYAVPEPTTMVAGALMLIPFGGSALRKLRKKA